MPKDIRGGHPTYWTTFGEGARKALLIHCSLAHSGAWNGVADELKQQLHMTAFDLPGHGRSDEWDSARDMQEMCVAMAADVIGHGGPVDVIGHSFGATVALRLAIEHPELVRSLVLIENVMVAAAIADDPELAQAQSEAMSEYQDAVERQDQVAAARAFMREWGDGTPWNRMPKPQQAFLADRIHLIAANNATVLLDQPGILEKRRIEGVEAPSLLIRGAESAPIVEKIHAAIARRLPNAESLAIEGGGHMVPITHPEATAGHIAQFLKRVPE